MRIGDTQAKRVGHLYRKSAEAGRKIEDDSINVEKTSSSTGTSGSGKVEQAGAPAGRGGPEDARLGLEEHKYEVAAEAVARVPDIRPEKEARIEELRTMIANGTYKVDADEVAKRLLASGLFDDLT